MSSEIDLSQLDLVRLEIETLWETDRDGQLLHARTPKRWPAPLCVVAATTMGLCAATRHDVSPEDDAEIRRLVEQERHQVLEVGWQPDCASEILNLLAENHLVADEKTGPTYVLAAPPNPATDVVLRTSETGVSASVWSTMPSEDRDLAAPWVVAIVEGRVAAVCETARSARRAVEAGVWTYPDFRRSGLATAVVAAWARLVDRRVVFYSTDAANLASQATAVRAGALPLAQMWLLPSG